MLRDGEITEIDAAQLVPGDLVRVEAGDRIPADAPEEVAATVAEVNVFARVSPQHKLALVDALK